MHCINGEMNMKQINKKEGAIASLAKGCLSEEDEAILTAVNILRKRAHVDTVVMHDFIIEKASRFDERAARMERQIEELQRKVEDEVKKSRIWDVLATCTLLIASLIHIALFVLRLVTGT